MFQLIDKKPCADYEGYIQAEGKIVDENFTVDAYHSKLKEKKFTVYIIGDPQTLVCKRADCLLMIQSDQTFNISQVKKEEDIQKILNEVCS